MLKKILIGIVGLMVIVIIGIIGFINLTYEKDYSAGYPVKDVKVVADSSMIERGRYLAQGPAHCIDCHSPLELVQKSDLHTELSMSGGFGLEIPPGTFYAPNITPDAETGIGRYTDGELYRMLRYNIRPDGQAAIDFMPFINMSDEDIYAVIAYLRSQPAVKNKMPERDLSFLGKALFASGVVKPGVPDEPVVKSIQPDTSEEYGRYLAYAVANCMGCHTERDMKSGEFIGKEYAGGLTFGPDDLTKGWIYVSPNITPDKQTGIMADWEEEDFIARMKAGKVYETSPMPWTAFTRMSDDDLKAIYRFLKTVQPVAKIVGEVAIPPKENM